MTTTAPATKTRHVRSAIRNGQPEIVRVFGYTTSAGAWGEAINAHAEAEDARIMAGTAPRELHHAVRDSDHELVQAAAQAEAAKLGKRQAEILKTLALATAPAPPVTAGQPQDDSPDPARWDRAARQVGMANVYTGDIAAPARKLAAKGLLTIAAWTSHPRPTS